MTSTRILNPWRIFNTIGASGGGEARIEFNSGGVTLRAVVPSNQLWVAIKDVLVYEDYEFLESFRLSRLPAHSTVVDAGAFVGLYSLKASMYAERVVALEPSKQNYECLEENVRMNGIHNIDARRIALSSAAGPSRFTEAGTISGLDEQGRLVVDATTLDDIVASLGHVDLLKMDIEGAEYNVFAAGSSALRRIDKLTAEVHVYKEAHRIGLDGLITSLQERGFIVQILPSPFQGVFYGVTKPWRCALKSYNNGRATLYRLLLSLAYGTGPAAKILKRSSEVGSESVLFAWRK